MSWENLTISEVPNLFRWWKDHLKILLRTVSLSSDLMMMVKIAELEPREGWPLTTAFQLEFNNSRESSSLCWCLMRRWWEIYFINDDTQKIQNSNNNYNYNLSTRSAWWHSLNTKTLMIERFNSSSISNVKCQLHVLIIFCIMKSRRRKKISKEMKNQGNGFWCILDTELTVHVAR